MQLSKKTLSILRRSQGRPVSLEEIQEKIGRKKVKKKDLEGAIKVLLAESKVVSTKGGYQLTKTPASFRGVFRATSKGYGFVSVAERDFFIPKSKTNGAMDGDEVEIEVGYQRRNKEHQSARVVSVLKRANKQVVGRYQEGYKFGYLWPENHRLNLVLIPNRLSKAAKTGDVVVAEIDVWPQGRRQAQGRITKIIGNENQPGVDIDAIVLGYKLADQFSKQALAEAKEINEAITSKITDNRLDLRDLYTVTIDGLDAKDFDDAVSLGVDDRGFFDLGVHIADVSHYVPLLSAIDMEAYQRANSVYLPDRVLPMLPEKLSNQICSLQPGVERLTYSVLMRIDPDGEVKDFKIAETVIRSNHRLTYEEVDDCFKTGNFSTKKLRQLLLGLHLLSQVRASYRLDRGSLEFETVEPKIVLDEQGVPKDILIRERTPATQLIEECMIAANETVAEFMAKAGAPMIYRIHQKPDPEAVLAINQLVKELGYPVVDISSAHPRTFQALINFAHNRPEKLLINSLLLRSMAQARYSSNLETHFGLASPTYTHFTSPIRRYSDLTVHRLLKAVLRKELDTKPIKFLISQVEEIARHCSEQERKTQEAEREATEAKICQYMKDKIGGKFEAVISGVTAFGLFVELPNSAEGLVQVESLRDDYYRFDSRHFLLRGRRSGKTYRLGQKVEVKLTNVSVAKRQMDFVLA